MKKIILFSLILTLNSWGCLAQDWDPMNPPNAPADRHGHNMNAMPDGRVYLFGGEGSQGELFNDLFVFEENDWRQIIPDNDPPKARRDHTSWLQDNVMYVNGGKGANGPLNDLWAYNTSSNQWTEIQVDDPKPTGLYGHTSTRLPDGSIIIVGGKGILGMSSKECWKYNPEQQTYQRLANAPRSHSDLVAHMVNSDVLAIFGMGLIQFYQVSQDAWGLMSSDLPMYSISSSAMAENTRGETVVFVFGGKDKQGVENDIVYEFNTVTGELTQLAVMPQPVVNGASVVLQEPQQPLSTTKPLSSVLNNTPVETMRMLFFGGISNGVPTSTTLGLTIHLDETMPGDINANGITDLQDALLSLQVVSGQTPHATVYPEADVNGDHRIGLEEAIYILQNISELPAQ